MARANAGIHFRRQPTNTTCGQTCIAMLVDRSVYDVSLVLGHRNKTTTKEVVKTLRFFGVECPDKRVIFKQEPEALPTNQPLLLNVSRLNAKGNACWRHWIIYHAKQYYDPGWGIWRSWPINFGRDARVRSYLPLDVIRLRRYYV